MCQKEGFHYFLNHVKQRLVIIMDHNIPSGVDPCQSDIDLMRSLYNVYETGEVDTYSDVKVEVDVKQSRLWEADTDELSE
jgi:DNA repair protein RadC